MENNYGVLENYWKIQDRVIPERWYKTKKINKTRDLYRTTIPFIGGNNRKYRLSEYRTTAPKNFTDVSCNRHDL